MYRRQLVLLREREAARLRLLGQVQRARLADRQLRLALAASPDASLRVEQQRPR
jgi:hypothetical protein